MVGRCACTHAIERARKRSHLGLARETEEAVRRERPGESWGSIYTPLRRVGHSEIPEISGICSECTPDVPPLYIDTGFQYKLPADFEFLNSRNRTHQCQSGSRRVPKDPRGPARAGRVANSARVSSIVLIICMKAVDDRPHSFHNRAARAAVSWPFFAGLNATRPQSWHGLLQ